MAVRALFVSTTLSVEAAQGLFEMVHVKVALVPAGTPVTPEILEVDVVTVAVPLITLQAPVPVVGSLPSKVKLPLLHLVWSVPAFAVVGVAEAVTSTVLLFVDTHVVEASVPFT